MFYCLSSIKELSQDSFMCSLFFAMEIVSWSYQESHYVKSTYKVTVPMLLLCSVVCDQQQTQILKRVFQPCCCVMLVLVSFVILPRPAYLGLFRNLS